jgi:hypothetical protein
MLNIELVYNLYESLTPDKKEQLRQQLFKKSRQTMAYFRRSKDISLSKLEIIADFFHMPLDYFRLDSSFDSNSVNNSNFLDKASMGANLIMENDSLRDQIAGLKREMETLKSNLNAKEETNEILKDLVSSLKSQIVSSK